MTKRVVITGMGSVSPLGQSWDEIRTHLRQNKNCVRYISEWDIYPELKTRLAAPVDNFSLPSSYTIKKRRGMGRVAQMAVHATEIALSNADLLGSNLLNNGLTGVSYGSATGSSDAAMEFFGLLENQSMDRIKGTTYLRMMSHTAAVNISVLFGTTGRIYSTSSACTAGSQGIGFAFEAIKNGLQTIMIAGGAEELCPAQAAVFDTVYSASVRNDEPSLSPRPFDKDRDGLVLSEGATTLILEDYEHAVQRGANILAEIVGFATNTDGKHLVKPNSSTMTKVMQLALDDAKLEPLDIDYVSGHGTATIHGDIAESNATQKIMGSKIPFSSLKSYIGHSLGASASLEAYVGIHLMQEGWLHGNLNLDHVDDKCGRLNYIQSDGIECEINHFMSNNFAFGGINTSLIFKAI